MGQPYTIKMPQLSDTMTEGVIISWEIGIGEKVSRGAVVATVETDKAIMDVEVFREGYLSGPMAPEGSVLPVGEPMAFLVATEEEIVREEAAVSTSSSSDSSSSSPSTAMTVAPRPSFSSLPSVSSDGPIASRPDGRKATPYARKLAGAWNIDLNRVQGTGPDGVIQATDVEQARSSQSASGGMPSWVEPLPHQLLRDSIPGNVRPMNSMEKAIASSMTSSLTLPTFRTMKRARPDALKKASKQRGVSMTVAIAKACALALDKHPLLNSAYLPPHQIVERDFVDVGMAVATPDGGLVVPVLRQCNTRELEDLVTDWKDLVQKARARRLKPEEFEHPTFMVSNMGMLGVDYFDAIPTPGTSAILAISSADEKGMPLTVTADHRIASGAQVAAFLNTLTELIEQPHTWLGAAGPSIPEGDWDYDVVVIGGCPGGQDCARHLVEHKLKVAMVNDSPLSGGECLWRGCIPSKMWRVAADKMRDRRHDAHLGIEWDAPPRVNWETLEASRRNVLVERGTLATKTDRNMKIDTIAGIARFEDDHHILVDMSNVHDDPHRRFEPGDGETRRISFGCAVIATGAPPFVPPIPGVFDSLATGGALTSDTVWNLSQQPKRLGVIGGGAIGLEMAQIFNDFGAEVAVVEMQDRVLAEADPEVAKGLTEVLNREENLTVVTSAKVVGVTGAPGEMEMKYEDAEGNEHTFACDYVLLATGKRPKLDKLGLESAGVTTENHCVKVGPTCVTNVPHIYAVGDVIGGLMLAHTAGQQGRVAADNILGQRNAYNQDKDCGVIFCRPQIGFVGLTVEQAKEKGFSPVEMKFPMKLDAKAMISGEVDGVVKLVADSETTKILGVHFFADHTDTLIGEGVMMVAGNMTLDQVANAIHPHPTTTEIFGEMARRLLSRIRRTKSRKKR